MFILKPKSEHDEFRSRLNALIVGMPATYEYSEPKQPIDPEYSYELWPIDDRAQSVLTPEEWASRLATMPAEFVRPLPE